jgi:CubicO group peptidase (beta-lactamase class C family)
LLDLLRIVAVRNVEWAGGPVRLFLAIVATFIAASAYAQPAGPWRNADGASGLSAAVRRAVQDYGNMLKPTAVMFVQDGRVIASFGDVSRKVTMQSVRKSLLSALYGIAVSEGRINLASTLTELGIDDNPPSLTGAEKQATVRDLLMARSGIYHPAAYETGDMAAKRPQRGSHAPGSFWYYNNWDFNALGTIYRKATGEDIFKSFEQRIARPLGMEDFAARDGQYVTEPQSIHQAYPFRLSARDAARFGLLFLNGGQWREQQVIPAAWIKESTATYILLRPIGASVAMAICGGRCNPIDGAPTRSWLPATVAKKLRSSRHGGSWWWRTSTHAITPAGSGHPISLT